MSAEQNEPSFPQRGSRSRGAAGIWLSAAALTCLLSACAGPRASAPPSVQTASATAPYVIGPGDTIGIFVYKAPELSVDLPVRPDGRISMPLVPDIDAAGRTPTQLADIIREKLRDYVVEPNVTVMVKSFVGPSASLVRVIGEAAQPLALPYRDGMTLLDVLIASHGLTRYAAGDRAQIVRQGTDGTQEVVSVRLSTLLRDGDVSQNMAMRPGDTLVIPRSWF